jgi:hypothetical protein
MDFDRSVFWPAFKEAGMLRSVSVKQSGKQAVTVDVKYEQPTQRIFGQQASQDLTIQYQAADLPYLKEDDPVTFLDAAGAPIRTERFKVREAPYVSANAGEDRSGYFKYALLTQI